MVSVFTLTFIAYDRYHAICNPLKRINSPTHKPKRAFMVILGMWVIAMVPSGAAFALTSKSPLDDTNLFDCKAGHITFDLSSCVPAWNEDTDFVVNLTRVSRKKKYLTSPQCIEIDARTVEL